MKTIGIKLADGSFYPVLEDNTPSEKQLELTTAHNNQTKVMVDLYRSATCSMDDAEYVDSLQIENLVARPNGEADIKFSVSLDEDNQLSAKIVDSETGNESNTSITLVSRTLEERLVTDEYGINDSEEKSGKGAAVAAGALAAGGLLAAAAAMRDKAKDEEPVEEEPEVETVEEDVPLGDETFVDEPLIEDTEAAEINDFAEESAAEEEAETPVIEETEAPEIEFDEAPAEGEETETPEIEFEEEGSPEIEFEETPAEENSAETFEETSDETITEDENPLPDMDFDLPEETSDETTTESDALPDMDFDLPDDSSADTTELNPDETIADTEEDTFSADDNLTEEDSGLPSMDFDLPEDTSEAENPEMPDDFFNTDDMDNTEETMKDPTFDSDSPVAGGLTFDGLYDEETERGSPAETEVEEVKKKTKVPVIICIICAIICIIATLLILFIIPSKYNLITKKHAKDAEKTVAIEQPAPEPAPAPIPEPEPEPAVPEAKEDEVIVIEKAEEVVPAQPPVAEEKPKNITYKIKWGDTLWDIADTYYKNPWRYKYIARYNGIKNPDYIISGTKIVIPAE